MGGGFGVAGSGILRWRGGIRAGPGVRALPLGVSLGGRPAAGRGRGSHLSPLSGPFWGGDPAVGGEILGGRPCCSDAVGAGSRPLWGAEIKLRV